MPLPERQLIAQIRRKLRSRSKEIAVGIGDDCAILGIPRGEEVLVTTDFSLEGVHFRREWQTPECTGHRCLARGLSDISAMGGHPIAAFLSLAVPSNLPQSWVDRFLFGLLRLARKYKVALAGGDTAQSLAGVLADIVVLGKVKRGAALLRSGAKIGDRIYVTGRLGQSATALELLKAGKITRRDVFPAPRIAVGEWLLKHQVASAAIDISDGLSIDLGHICEESGVGAAIRAETIPIHPAAQELGRAKDASISLNLALHGGEDYELLFTASPKRRIPHRIAGVQITQIGKIVRGKKINMARDGKSETLTPQGWEHFRGTT